MKYMLFASRNQKEIIRDPLNLAFGIGFPLVVLLLLSAIQANIPVSLFEIDQLAPGVAVFGLSFISLFSGMLIAKDRSTSFLLRLFASPLSSSDFILGYTLPLIPIAVLQSGFCFLVSFLLGLQVNLNVLLALLVLLPVALFFIAVGLLAGSIFTDKQVGGICGALLTNLSAWLSGTWFDLSLVGGTFKKIADLLPFVHAVNAGKAAITGKINSIFPDLWWVIVYALVLLVASILVFKKKMNSDQV